VMVAPASSLSVRDRVVARVERTALFNRRSLRSPSSCRI
jgi:hypothetical protein